MSSSNGMIVPNIIYGKSYKSHGSSHHQAVMVYQNTVPAFLVGVQWGTFVVAIAISMTNEDCDIL